MTMEIQVKKSTIVRPAQETPKHRLWISNLDRLMPVAHIPIVHLYRRPSNTNPNGDDDDRCLNFFEGGVLKETLSKVLVAFYPVAGRLTEDENGRLEIECNAEGVLFMEAETNCFLDDLGDFTPSSKLCQLVPTVNFANDISSCPLLVVQVTSFKCGGVCLGIGLHHTLVDGTSAIHFINTWAEMTRGLPISIPPFIDRTILQAMTPPYPTFDHIEFRPPPPVQTQDLQSSPGPTSLSSLKISLDQINTLKAKLKKDDGTTYSTYEILAAHIWRCVCKARGLPDDQLIRLGIPTNGRSRLNPPLPSSYFGNVVFVNAVIALAGEIQSEPLIFTVNKIHEAVKRMDDGYLKSALAYLKGRHDVIADFNRRGPSSKSSSLLIVSWTRMPIYDADFGWGRPLFAGRAIIPSNGVSYIFPTPSTDRSLLLIIRLETHHMELFRKFFYDF